MKPSKFAFALLATILISYGPLVAEAENTEENLTQTEETTMPDKSLITKEAPVILFEQDKSLLTTAVHIAFTNGSQEDKPEKAGLTHLMAELMIRGTQKKSREKFQSELEKLGATINAQVTTDSILFSGKVIQENITPFLKLLKETLISPELSTKEFNNLKRELLAEIAFDKNQNTRLGGLAVRKEIFEGSVLERPIRGGLKTVSNLKLSEVKEAYKKRIHRGAILFGFASPAKEATFKDWVQTMWKALPQSPTTITTPVMPKLPKKPKLIVVHKAGTSAGGMIMAQSGIVANDPKRYTLLVSNFPFGAEALVCRLFRTIRSELGWTYYIGSSYQAMGTLSNQPMPFVINASPSVEFTAKTVLKSLSMWKEYYQSGLKADELSMAKESLINSYPFEFDSAEKRLAQKFNSYLYATPILSPEEYEKTINAVDNLDIKQTLSNKHTLDSWVIAIVADSKVIEKQLAEEQKELPKEERITISKVITPEQAIE